MGYSPQSHHPTAGKPKGHQGQLRDGTNTDLEANTAQGLPAQESFNSRAGLTCSNKTTLWEGWWHPPAMLPTPVIASTTHVVPTQRGKARSLVVAQPAELPSARQWERRQPELSARGVAPPSGLKAARQDLRWQPNFANVISALRLENWDSHRCSVLWNSKPRHCTELSADLLIPV